jgi:hypothetical protein
VCERALKVVFAKINLKLRDENFTELDLEDEKKLAAKTFFHKLDSAGKLALRALREEFFAVERALATSVAIMPVPKKRETASLTHLYGVSRPLAQLIEDFDYSNL